MHPELRFFAVPFLSTLLNINVKRKSWVTVLDFVLETVIYMYVCNKIELRKIYV